MSEKPILFSGEMVRAILRGQKNQTRRVVKSPARNMQAAGDMVIAYRPPGDPWYKDYVWSMRDRGGTWGDYTHERFMQFCPYGQPGDRLWVRETWAQKADGNRVVAYKADGARHGVFDYDGGFLHQHHGWILDPSVPNHGKDGDYCGLGIFGDRWRPSIHMPRWASRITLEITDVRVERLQDISEEDARAEGVGPYVYGHGPLTPLEMKWEPGMCTSRMYRDGFEVLWNEINGAGAWDANAFVWAITFRRVAQEARGAA